MEEVTRTTMANGMTAVRSDNSTRRRAQQLAAFLGLVAAAADPTVYGPSVARAQVYRSAAEAPSTWRNYAMRLQANFQQRLAEHDKAVARIANEMAHARSATGASDASPPAAVTMRVWVAPNGKLERVAFDNLTEAAAADLGVLLGTADVGAPPPDMLQPLRLRLSLHTSRRQQQAR